MQPVVQRVLVPASENEHLKTPLCILCVVGDNFNWNRFWLGPYYKPPESLRNCFSLVVSWIGWWECIHLGNAIANNTFCNRIVYLIPYHCKWHDLRSMALEWCWESHQSRARHLWRCRKRKPGDGLRNDQEWSIFSLLPGLEALSFLQCSILRVLWMWRDESSGSLLLTNCIRLLEILQGLLWALGSRAQAGEFQD